MITIMEIAPGWIGDSMGDLESVSKEVLERVRPTEAERSRMEIVTRELVKRAEAAGAKAGVEIKPLVVGSAARGTWLKTERDIDIFLLFPEELSREELERQGLAAAREMAGSRGKERYAEHPYVRMKFREFQVDVVPAYGVSDPRRIKSAVDRTPFHQEYIRRKITPEIADQVLLVKQFMQGIGVYGAELRVQGFSGYLCELLTLNYGSFGKLVEAAVSWAPGVVTDIEGSFQNESEPRVLFEKQPLVVVDPVDPNRNVAAAVSVQNFATFVQACKDFSGGPATKFFFPKAVRLVERGELARTLKRRGTKFYCVVFQQPDISEDILFPQLRKTERALVGQLVQAGFEVIRSDVWADRRKAAILLELSIHRLSRVQSRPGPVATLDASNFIQEHLASPRRVAGPFVDLAGRVVFELERVETDASEAIERAVDEKSGFARQVAEAMGKGHKVLEDMGIASFFGNRSFKKFVSEYLAKVLPWYR